MGGEPLGDRPLPWSRSVLTSTRLFALLLVAALLLPITGPPKPAAAETGRTVVDAGSLRAVITSDPWHLRFVDADGQLVLAEAAGTGVTPTGTLGFETPTGWRHATHVVSQHQDGDGYRGVVATTDPLRNLVVGIAPDTEGVIAVEATIEGPTRADVTALGVGFEATDTERYLGFGERSNAVDQRGQVLENYVGEGTYPLEERPFLQAIVPHWGIQARDDATYFPVPWLLSTAGYGVLVDNDETSYFRLGTERADAWSLEVTGAPVNQPTGLGAAPPETLRFRVFAGPTPAEALGRFTAATGRQPEAAAPWYHGPWIQPVGGGFRGRVDELRGADVPVSVAQTFARYLPCGSHRDDRARQRNRTRALHDAGVAVTTYLNPMICTAFSDPYDEAAAGDGLTRRRDGKPYVYRYPNWPHFASQQDLRYLEVSQFDFTSDVGREVFKGLLGEAVEDGYDGWMQDYGEYTPLDAVSADGTPGNRMHNRYPVLYHCTAAEVESSDGRPLGRFIRSGFTGVAPCADIVWGGDPTTTWDFDGLTSAVRNGLTMGLSGITLWGSDIGGLFANGLNRLTPELKIRWIQFGAVSGVMRDQAGQFAIPDTGDKVRPQIWDPEILPHWRRYAKLRTQLYPYLTAAEQQYQATGVPVMRHHALTHPNDPAAVERDDQFLFGADLLAAPITSPGQTERELYLPEGAWLPFWSAVRYDETDGGLHVGAPTVLAGGREITVPAPLEELPLLIRAGAVLPLLPPTVETLAGHGPATLERPGDHLRLLAFPRGVSQSRFLDDGRLRSIERDRGNPAWTLTIEGDAPRTYDLETSMATLERPFVPCHVTVDGRLLAREAWSYEPAAQVLSLQVTGEQVVVEARACGPRNSSVDTHESMVMASMSD